MSTGNADALQLLDRAIAQTGAVIDQVRADQSTLPTPCPSFDVRTLVNHTVFDVQLFTSMIDGGERGSSDADLIGQDWSAAFTRASEGLRAAWQAKGIDGTINNQLGEFPASWAAMQHVADLAVHGWDIAVATGQSTAAFDTELAEASLAWAKGALKPEFRGPDKSFGLEVTVPDDAPAYDRLVAFFGRDPGR
jgi:uncharacterized protein (TIGR03086 family)